MKRTAARPVAVAMPCEGLGSNTLSCLLPGHARARRPPGSGVKEEPERARASRSCVSPALKGYSERPTSSRWISLVPP